MENSGTKMKNYSLISKVNNKEKEYANERWENSLTLRKRKINAIISKQRGFYQFKNEGQMNYQIMKENLDIPLEIKNKKYDNLEQFFFEMKKFIQSNDITYNKYSLYCIRTHTLNIEGSDDKKNYIELLQKYDYVSDILFLIQKYLDYKEIIFEGLWIIINILYFQNENTDLIMFLSNQLCIQLYIKILDKKDKVLRLNIYWLLSNLLNNNNIGITNQVLFHLYMTTIFRLYIFKDLEDNNSELKDIELYHLIVIISRLSEFINDTFIRLRKNDIQNFIDYNPNVNYNIILENNNFLFYHSILHFKNNIENPKLTSHCVYGLSKLSNFLDDSIAYNKFFVNDICLKLIKGEIKVEEDFLNFVVQIIGNYLNYTPEHMIDSDFLEKTINYLVKLLQAYPTKQYLKRDIFWSASNVSAGDSKFCEIIAKSGLLLLALQSIISDNDIVINEALFMLIGFFNSKNIEVISNNIHLDYIKNLFLCLQNIHNRCIPGEQYKNMEIIEKVLVCIGYLFENGNLIKNKLINNKFILDFEKNGGFHLLETLLSENNLSKEVSQIAEILLNFQKENK
jgi:hypothetical protein